MTKENQAGLSRYLTEAPKETLKPVLGLGKSALRAVAQNIAQRLTRVGGRASSGIKRELIEKTLK